MKQIGKVVQLNLFPVKSMQGMAVDSAELWWYGLDGDRKVAFVKSDDPSSFPWLTGRDLPDLVRYRARFVDPSQPANSAIQVETVDGLDLPVDDPALLQSLTKHSGRPLHLMTLNRGVFDAMPISLLSTSTVQSIADGVAETDSNVSVDMRRFRANLVVDVDQPSHGFPEERWLNRTIAFGNAADAPQIQTNYRTQRCAMVNIDPDTSARTPTVLKKVGQLWSSCAGIYAAAKQLGTIRVGDPVYVSET